MIDPAVFNPYELSPQEWAEMDRYQVETALGWVGGDCARVLMAMRNLRITIFKSDDDDERAEAEYRWKMLKTEESSLHRLAGILQSRAKLVS